MLPRASLPYETGGLVAGELSEEGIWQCNTGLFHLLDFELIEDIVWISAVYGSPEA